MEIKNLVIKVGGKDKFLIEVVDGELEIGIIRSDMDTYREPKFKTVFRTDGIHLKRVGSIKQREFDDNGDTNG